MSCETDKLIQALAAQVAELQDNLDTISKATKPFVDGHPILLMQNSDDIALFDLTTGKGVNTWEGWALCDGKTHYNVAGKKNITTPNFVDRFVVMAGGEYSLDATGGEKEVTLIEDHMPKHTHPLSDPGHTHAVTDPGHTHGVTDAGHTHTQDPHDHAYGDEKPSVPSAGVLLANFTGGGPDTLGDSLSAKTVDPTTAVNNTATTGVTVDSEVTGITNQNNTTGITMLEAGADGAHNNMPPYYAAIYIMKIN